MSSLIDVIDSRELYEKKKLFDKYLKDSSLGELPHLEKAYFQILYDIYFISDMDSEDAYPQYKMINIVKVTIEYDKNLDEKYFRVYFRNGETLEIGNNSFIVI